MKQRDICHNVCSPFDLVLRVAQLILQPEPRPAKCYATVLCKLFNLAFWIHANALSYAAQAVFPLAAPHYSSSFVTPKPPNITAEFRANYMQHKYDINIDNHIISGFMYMSPSLGKIRLDGADDGNFLSSLFDFTNTTTNGTLVANSILSYSGGLTSPACTSFFVPPFIPLVGPDILTTTGAVYTGVQNDELYGAVSGWTFNYAGVVVHMFIDPNNTLVRYDFAAPGPLRTFATTRFFNIIPGPMNATVFETLCP